MTITEIVYSVGVTSYSASYQRRTHAHKAVDCVLLYCDFITFELIIIFIFYITTLPKTNSPKTTLPKTTLPKTTLPNTQKMPV